MDYPFPPPSSPFHPFLVSSLFPLVTPSLPPAYPCRVPPPFSFIFPPFLLSFVPRGFLTFPFSTLVPSYPCLLLFSLRLPPSPLSLLPPVHTLPVSLPFPSSPSPLASLSEGFPSHMYRTASCSLSFSVIFIAFIFRIITVISRQSLVIKLS